MSDDSLDDVSVLFEFACPAFEMFATGAAAIEHFGGCDIVDGAANRAELIDVVISECREFLAGLLIRQRIAHNGLFRDLW